MAAMMKRFGFFVLALGLLCPLRAQNAGDGSSTAADEAEMSAMQRRMQGEVDKRSRRINAAPGAPPAAKKSSDGYWGSPVSDEEALPNEERVSDEETTEATVIMTLPPGSKMPPVRPSPGLQRPPPNVNTPGPQRPQPNINKPSPPINKPNVNKPKPQGAQTYRNEPGTADAPPRPPQTQPQPRPQPAPQPKPQPKPQPTPQPKPQPKPETDNQVRRLGPREIKQLQQQGHDPHDLKPNSRYDLFKDKQGNIEVRPKNGQGPGEKLNIRITDEGTVETISETAGEEGGED